MKKKAFKLRLWIVLAVFMAAITILLAACTNSNAGPTGNTIANAPSSNAQGNNPGTALDNSTNTTPQDPVISISLTNYPTDANGSFNVSWKVDSDTALISPHTAVHYDTVSHPGTLTTDMGPTDSGYPTFTQEYAQGQYNIPNTFTGQVNPPDNATILYMRAHVIANNKNYWTDEVSVNIIPASTSNMSTNVSENNMPSSDNGSNSSSSISMSGNPGASANWNGNYKMFVVNADDNGLYPSSLYVYKGDNVTITFNVSTNNVYYGGLDFRSGGWAIGPIPPGANGTISFIADSDMTYSSYWPNTSRLKATGHIFVQ